MKAERLYGLVLAGGQSRRMGSDKALLVRNGESQLQRAMTLLGEFTDKAFVSVREDQATEKERSRFPQIVDRYDDMGPLAGILSAMDHAPDARWLVLACDLPNVDRDTIAKLVADASPADPFTAFRSSHDGLPEPLCSLYTPAARPQIDALAAEGIRCPRKILIVSNATLLEQPHPAALDNMNTPDDLSGTGVRIAS